VIGPKGHLVHGLASVTLLAHASPQRQTAPIAIAIAPASASTVGAAGAIQHGEAAIVVAMTDQNDTVITGSCTVTVAWYSSDDQMDQLLWKIGLTLIRLFSYRTKEIER
jgi:DNA-binding MurR/RpiR family transcriptional regulator